MDETVRASLLKKAGSLLARRAFSRGEMRDRLAPLGGAAEVDAALAALEQRNLLNDAEYAYNFALRRCGDEGWSPGRVRHELERRRVAPAEVDRALERVRSELGGGAPVLARYLRKRFGSRPLPADAKGVRRLILHLGRRGFEMQDILRALRGEVPAAVLERFETGECID